MERIPLGSTALIVSRLCLGLENTDTKHARQMLRDALAEEVTWWDFAPDTSGAAVREVLQEEDRARMVLSAQSAARTYQEVTTALVTHLAELQTEYLDILFLRDVENLDDLKAREDAVAAMLEAKARGGVLKLGVHTMHPEVMHCVGEDARFDVLMASLGNPGPLKFDWREQIESSTRHAYDAGRGVVLSDILQGQAGHEDPQGVLQWAASQSAVASLRFAPASNVELHELVHFLCERQIEPHRLQFLWHKAA